MKNLKYIIGLVCLTSIFLVSCEKEFDTPELTAIPTGNVITIADLRAMHVPGTTVEINDEISVYGVVTADETSGNLYKESVIQDETGAMVLRFIGNTGLYIGDSIRVYLKGTKLLRYNQMMQLDSLHPDNNITKVSPLQNRKPEVVSINDITLNLEYYQGKLIQLNNVRFTEAGQGKTFADAENLESVGRYLQDLNGAQIEVRTSGYANFASDTLPVGIGKFIGIMAQYNSGAQLLVRNPNELTLTGEGPIVKDFNDSSLTSGGWTTQLLAGSISVSEWGIYPSTNSAAKVTCFNSTTFMGEISDAWLISPSLDLSNSTTPSFNFRNVVNFDLAVQLKVLVSMDYDGVSNPNTATWTDLTSSAIWDTDATTWGSWTSSGDLDLSPFISSNVYVAFEYVGINSANVGTWEIDDITITK